MVVRNLEVHLHYSLGNLAELRRMVVGKATMPRIVTESA